MFVLGSWGGMMIVCMLGDLDLVVLNVIGVFKGESLGVCMLVGSRR